MASGPPAFDGAALPMRLFADDVIPVRCARGYALLFHFPEPCDGPILGEQEQLAQRGVVHLHGPAGTVILFNLSVLHAATVRTTPHERKTVQIYYGHRGGPVLSDGTMIPTSLWRDHPDPEVRGFYGLMTTRSLQYAKAFG